MSKYASLNEYLQSLGRQEWSANFADVEKLIGGVLPKSAYIYPAWWANSLHGHSHSKSWLDAGWVTEDVNLKTQSLVFRKVNPSISQVALHGFLKGQITILFGNDITEPVDAEWGGDILHG